jgi:hypothetical protein
MIDSETNGKSRDESGIKSVQDKKTELRILPYYCSWYRSIFPRTTSERLVNSAFRTNGD